ncbi:MAG: hypothetical protein ACRDCE_10510 [Cetobacterium sp.]|uniref:hypothetical protein n=1 Tax=Cetobacterium sp. TaxID=2071632 RepID=UPI003EE42DC7
MSKVHIRIARKSTIAELLAQIPLEMSPEVSDWIGRYMSNRFLDNQEEDHLWFGFNRDVVMESVVRGLGLGYMPDYYHYGQISSGDWYRGEGYTELVAPDVPAVLSNYKKFQQKCEELGYTKIGYKKYRNLQGRIVNFKEQIKSGGTRPQWVMAFVNREDIVYCGAAAEKIAGSFNSSIRQRFTPLADFLGQQ